MSANEIVEPLDETWKYRIPESLADLIPLFENRIAVHRLWAEWLDQDTDETRRYAEHGIGPAKAHWDYVKQYSAAKSLVEGYERAALAPATQAVPGNMVDMVERVADALETAELGYSMELIRLVDGESTYRLKYSDGETLEFSSSDEVYEHVAQRKRLSQATAAIAAMLSQQVLAKRDALAGQVSLPAIGRQE
ncbi:MAG: hypothetical protein EOS20_18425 [Mesorhizobium sp.]|uniref:hypothetical protein n=1 Tax=Mesorhizobium sp. TaxID=1871066 RepID=UPI000FE95A25|nr:hypothetical protein [Mesorhizobium sp.]RWQ35485.1 MAG: hypothetical protein EOS20_18425 [Mesorhizobium sp.]RWQ38683.1 MAG: hypothetical protein EOS21_19275 [Mesorhizobium sp.]